MNSPAALMVPIVVFQVTVVFVAFFTVAVNCRVVLTATDAVDGETVIRTGGGGGAAVIVTLSVPAAFAGGEAESVTVTASETVCAVRGVPVIVQFALTVNPSTGEDEQA